MNLADYDQKYQTNLESTTRTLCQKWNVPEGEQRLKLVIQHFSTLSPDQAYQLLNPEAYRREVEETRTYKKWSTRLLVSRIVLSLAPLIVTWFSLSWAVLSYSIYIQSMKDQAHIPSLLQAWQAGLLGPLTFFWTGFIDVILLILFLGATLGSLRLEYCARSESETFAQELKSVTDELMKAVAREGRHEASSEDEIERIMRYIKSAIAESYKDIVTVVEEVETVVDKAKETIVKTGETVEKMFETQIKPTFANIDPSIKEFRAAVKDFHTDLHAFDNRVKGLTDASAQIVSAVGDIAVSTTAMANSASDLTSHVRQQTNVSSSIDQHLVELHKAEQEMTQTSTQIASATSGIVASAAQIASSADNLATYAREQTETSTAIDQHLVQLNKTEQEMTQASTHIASATDTIATSTVQIASNTSHLIENIRQQTDMSATIDKRLAQLDRTEQEMAQTLKQIQGELVKEIRSMSQEVAQLPHLLQNTTAKVEIFSNTISPQLAQQTENAHLFAQKAEEVTIALNQASQAFQQVNTDASPRWWPFRAKKRH